MGWIKNCPEAYEEALKDVIIDGMQGLISEEDLEDIDEALYYWLERNYGIDIAVKYALQAEQLLVERRIY